MQGGKTYADEFVSLLALCPGWMPWIAVQEEEQLLSHPKLVLRSLQPPLLCGMIRE